MSNTIYSCFQLNSVDNDKLTSKVEKSNSNVIRAAFYKEKIWKQFSTITISFMNDFKATSGVLSFVPLEQIDKVKINDIKLDREMRDPKICPTYSSMFKYVISKRIEPLINLKLKWLPNRTQNANVRITFDSKSGSWSTLGTDCLRKIGATLNIGWLDKSVIIHEFCHTLGMIHEHQNPYGKPIQWNVKNVLEDAKSSQGWDKCVTASNILCQYSKNLINGSDYDPLSIMKYYFKDDWVKNQKGSLPNWSLSYTDIKWIYDTYPNNNTTPEKFYKEIYNLNPPTSTPITTTPTSPTPTSPTTTSTSTNSTFDNFKTFIKEYYRLNPVLTIVILFIILSYIFVQIYILINKSK